MLKYLIILISPLILTGCFEVIEEVNLNEDNSGEFKVTLNLSKSKGQVKSLLSIDTIKGKRIPSIAEIEKAIDDLAKDLEAYPGISNVKTKKNFEDFILSINYTFNTVETLNKSIQYIIEKHTHNRPNLSKTNFYKLEGDTFTRSDEFDFGILMTNFSSDTKVLETSTYTCIYRFPNSIASQSNTDAKTSKSGKASMHKMRAAQLIRHPNLIKNNIKYHE